MSILYDGSGNEIEVGGGGTSVTYPISNTGYQRATTRPAINNIFANRNEHSGTLQSTDGIYYNTVGWVNPSEKHIVYMAAWVKFNFATTVYSMLHRSNLPVDLINQDKEQENKGGALNGILVVKTEVAANTWTYVYGELISNGGGSNATNNSITIGSVFDDSSVAATATMSIKEGVLIDLTAAFGAGYEPTADGMKALLDGASDYYITENYNIFTASILKETSQSKELRTANGVSPYIGITEYDQIVLNSIPNKDWPNWDYNQYNYAMRKTTTPVNINVHGGFETDSHFSCVPIWGPWTENANPTVKCIWGGHIFHGWNSCQTYRLTMMASGNMSDPTEDPNFVPREDEFCIQVFSPAYCYPNPINLTQEQAANRVVQDPADNLKGGHYYGRIRIGADVTNMGFVFRCRSLTCYGDVDINGKKLILGDQAGEHNVPASASSTGTAGQISYDSDYLYVCTATNTWKRIPLSW